MEGSEWTLTFVLHLPDIENRRNHELVKVVLMNLA